MNMLLIMLIIIIAIITAIRRILRNEKFINAENLFPPDDGASVDGIWRGLFFAFFCFFAPPLCLSLVSVS